MQSAKRDEEKAGNRTPSPQLIANLLGRLGKYSCDRGILRSAEPVLRGSGVERQPQARRLSRNRHRYRRDAFLTLLAVDRIPLFTYAGKLCFQFRAAADRPIGDALQVLAGQQLAQFRLW